MSLLFCDGFDNYDTLADFWDLSPGDANIRIPAAHARTGLGALQINSGGFGPGRSIPHSTDILFATNWYTDLLPGPCMSFLNTDADTGFNATVFWINVLNDGNIQAYWHPSGGGFELGRTSTPGLVVPNTFVSIACRAFCSYTAGSLKVWVNGVLVLNLVNVRTAYAALFQYYNGVRLLGPGGLPTLYHDDVYCLDCSTPPNDDFEGALRIYALPPTANAGVTWTPNAGTNWSNVSEVPPDGDTSYNSSGNVGDQDQYVYPIGGVPANCSIPFVQHELDLKVDSGSRSVGSVINGTAVQGAIGLSSGYHIYPTPYDVNPSTGVAFVPADFPVNAGPKVTA